MSEFTLNREQLEKIISDSIEKVFVSLKKSLTEKIIEELSETLEKPKEKKTEEKMEEKESDVDFDKMTVIKLKEFLTSKHESFAGRDTKATLVMKAKKLSGIIESKPPPPKKTSSEKSTKSVEEVPKSKKGSTKSVEEVPKPKKGSTKSAKSVEEVPKSKKGSPKSAKSVKEVPKSKNGSTKSVEEVSKSVEEVPKSKKGSTKSVEEVPKSKKDKKSKEPEAPTSGSSDDTKSMNTFVEKDGFHVNKYNHVIEPSYSKNTIIGKLEGGSVKPLSSSDIKTLKENKLEGKKLTQDEISKIIKKPNTSKSISEVSNDDGEIEFGSGSGSNSDDTFEGSVKKVAEITESFKDALKNIQHKGSKKSKSSSNSEFDDVEEED